MSTNGAPPKRPTKRQWEWLDAIKLLKQARRYDPSYHEICMVMGVSSTASVHQMLNRMQRAGLVKLTPGAHRKIEVLV